MTATVLVLLAALGAFLFYRFGGLDWWFERQLRAEMTKMNIRMEVRTRHLGIYPGSAELEGLVLYPGTDEIPIASIDKVTAKFDVTSLLGRRAEVRSLELVHPVFNIRFDENGRSNLDAINWPERAKEAAKPTSQITYQMATLAIENGQVNYGDAVRKIDGTVDNVKFGLTPKGDKQPDGSAAAYRFALEFANSKLAYEGRELAGISGKVGADLTRDGATVDTLSLDSPAGTTTASGTITDWKDPKYDFQVGSTVSLERVGAVADPNAGLTGRAGVNGHLTGHGTEYHFDGNLTGDDLLVAGVRIADLSADGQLQGERLDYAWAGQLAASRVVAPDFDVSGVRFKGRVEGSGARATASGDLSASRVAGDGFVGTGLTFRGTVNAAGRTASGDVGLASVALRTVRVGSVRARVTADSDRVDVEHFTAVVYGGSVSGSARAQLGGGTSSLEAEFRGVDVDKALGASSPDAPRLAGRANGRVALSWPGTNVRAATGKVNATVDGTLPAAEGQPAAPVTGDIALTAVPGRFRIDRAEFASGNSHVSATGTVGWDRRSDIQLTATAENGADLVALLSAANPAVGESIRDAGLAIAGQFSFEGHVTGPLANPNVEGHVDVDQVAVNDEVLGHFTGDVRRERGVLALSGAKLTRPADLGGGEVVFDMTMPSSPNESQTITARISRFPLRSLFKASPIGVPPVVEGFGGIVNGTVDLRVPPGGKPLETAVGKVDVTVEGAQINGEPVQAFRVAADLAPDEIRVSDLRVATARGALTGSAVYGRRSGVYRADFAANNVDLGLIAGTPAAKAVALSGTASGTLAVEGNKDGLTRLQADVTGTDVVANGQAVANPRLTIMTAPDARGEQVANVELAADFAGERRQLAGKIYVARKHQPFEFSTSLAGADIMKFMPNPPEGVTTRVTGDVRVAGLLDDLPDTDGLSVEGSFSELALTAALDTAGRSYSIANRGDVVFKAVNGVIEFQNATFTGEGTELTLSGGLAMRPDAVSNLKLEGDVNLALLTSFTRDAYAGGVATVSASIGGTLADPRFLGFADVRDASLRVVDLPISIQNGNGRVLFTANQALIQSFTAQSNGGRVVVDGGVLFAGLRPARWRFGINAEAIRVTYPEDVRSVIDGDLSLQGNQQLQVLSGTVNVRRAEYTTDVELSDLLALDEEHSRGTFSATTGTGGRGTSPIRLDLTVEARDSIVVRNNLADVVASASLALSGPIDDPVIDGRATVTHGTINFRNGEYQVTRGVVRFPGRLGGGITFDLLAESEIKGYRVSIGLSGTPDKPYPVLRSEPPLPETQIVSLVLTGDLGSSEEGTSALTQSSVGLASSLLSEAVSRSVEKRTSKLFGINRFQIDPLVGGTNPSARVTLGRQVNKNLSIIYSTNVTSGQEQVIQIEYRISDRFSVVATRDERGAYGLDFRVRKRF